MHGNATNFKYFFAVEILQYIEKEPLAELNENVDCHHHTYRGS